MSKLKKILKEQYYLEAPDQLNLIKEKVDLTPSNSNLIRLQRQNLFLKYSNVFSIIIILLAVVIYNANK